MPKDVLTREKVVPPYHEDVIALAIAIEHRGAERKERGNGNDVVLKHDALGDLSQEPVDGAGERLDDTHMLVTEEGSKLAWPVYRGYELPRGGATLGLSLAIWTRSVRGDVEHAGPSLTDGGENLRRGVRTVEGD